MIIAAARKTEEVRTVVFDSEWLQLLLARLSGCVACNEMRRDRIKYFREIPGGRRRRKKNLFGRKKEFVEAKGGVSLARR